MSVSFEEVRKEWPVLDTMTFLDAACVSFTPRRAVDAVIKFAEMTARQDESDSSAHHIAMDNLRNKAYQEACKLLNADPEEIAIVESTSHGLNIAANAIELQDGDNILTTNLEFIQVALPWCVMRNEKNLDIRVVEAEENRFSAADFAAHCDERTKLIVLSSVQWCNGWKIDLRELGEMCRSRGIYLVVDAVQQMGISNLDTKSFHVDFLVAGGHKWLNSPFGAGVLYINKKTMPEFKSVYHGYLNTKVPPEGWAGYWENPAAKSVNDWEFEMTARKFEIGGTSNYPGTIALGESLALVNEIGIENIENYILDLGDYCMKRLKEIGATVITHPEREHRAGLVVARLYQDLATERKILKALHSRKVFIAQRFTDYVGGFRISCQYFNNKKDVDAMINAMQGLIAEIGRAPDYQKGQEEAT